jgi:hypothetical protein
MHTAPPPSLLHSDTTHARGARRITWQVASDSEAYMHTYGTEMQSPADFSPADFSPADAGHELPHR